MALFNSIKLVWSPKVITELATQLATEFDNKHLGLLHCFMGIEVAYSFAIILLCQQKYTIELLQTLGKEDSCPLLTSIEANHCLSSTDTDDPVDSRLYQRVVEKLLYTVHRRPDIANTVGVLNQFLYAPQACHMHAFNRVLRYLKETNGRGLLFKRHGGLGLQVYTDADYAGSQLDRRSTTGYNTYLGGNLITWRSKKQNVVAHSSAKAEFRALAQSLCEAL